ncbi:MAG: hypothetical protein GVX78_02870, partial [Bacteroidetes bacterium]|nr:hypothetical protein [Bacteroidota bacterium]
QDKRTQIVGLAKAMELLLLLLLLFWGTPRLIESEHPLVANRYQVKAKKNAPAMPMNMGIKSNVPEAESPQDSLQQLTDTESLRLKGSFTSPIDSKAEKRQSLIKADTEKTRTSYFSAHSEEKNKALQSNIAFFNPFLLCQRETTLANGVPAGFDPAAMKVFEQPVPLLPTPKIDQLPHSTYPNHLSEAVISHSEITERKTPEAYKYGQSIGLISGLSFNRIKTSSDPIYPIPAKIQFDRNIYLGLEWEERNGSNAFGLTAGYQHWTYIAPQYNEIYQRPGVPDLQFIRLENLTFDMLNFGVFARKYFPHDTQWEFFLHFGGGLQLALNSNYRVRSGEISELNINSNDLTPEEIAQLPLSPQLWTKDFHKGVFQGGSINENSFMVVNIGGGLVRHLSSRWLLQFSPMLTLSPFSDGLGPNRDNIQSLHFQLQIRRSFE